MRKINLVILLIIMLFSLFSCIKPHEDAEEVSLIYLIKDVLDSLNEASGDPKKQGELFENIQKKYQVILAFYKGTKIFIDSKKAEVNENDIFYTLDNNIFELNRPIYFTFFDKDPAYSFDNKTWYLTKSNQKEKINGLNSNYNYFSKIDKNNLFVTYQATFKMGIAPEIIKMNKKREIVELSKGQIFSTSKKNIEVIELDKKILFLPKGTRVQGNLNVEGNVVKSNIDNDKITVEAVQNIFIYIKNKMFSISLDKKKWGVNPLSFDIQPVFEVKAIEDNLIIFDIEIDLNHFKDKTSMSIVKLLLNMR